MERRGSNNAAWVWGLLSDEESPKTKNIKVKRQINKTTKIKRQKKRQNDINGDRCQIMRHGFGDWLPAFFR